MPYLVRGQQLKYNQSNATLGVRLRRLRLGLGVTIAQFATKAGLGRNTVARLERGVMKKPRPWVLGRILAAYGNQVAQTFPEYADTFDWAIPKDDLGNCVRNLRLRQGLMQKELARELGVSRNAVYRYERNLSKPLAPVMERLKELLQNNNPPTAENQKTEVSYEERN